MELFFPIHLVFWNLVIWVLILVTGIFAYYYLKDTNNKKRNGNIALISLILLAFVYFGAGFYQHHFVEWDDSEYYFTKEMITPKSGFLGEWYSFQKTANEVREKKFDRLFKACKEKEHWKSGDSNCCTFRTMASVENLFAPKLNDQFLDLPIQKTHLNNITICKDSTVVFNFKKIYSPRNSLIVGDDYYCIHTMMFNPNGTFSKPRDTEYGVIDHHINATCIYRIYKGVEEGW